MLRFVSLTRHPIQHILAWLAVLTLADAFTTYIGVGLLGGYEVNPFMAAAIEASWVWFFVIKLTAFVTLLYFSETLDDFVGERLLTVGMATVLVFYIGIVLANSLQILITFILWLA